MVSEIHQPVGRMGTNICIREQRTSSSLIKGKMFNVHRKVQRLPKFRVEKIRISSNAEVPK